MTIQTINKHPRLVRTLQLALLVGIFQAVISTSPSGHLGAEAAASGTASYLSEKLSLSEAKQ